MTRLGELDRAHLIHPHATFGKAEEPIVWSRGRGALLWDSEGNEYVDGTCGLWLCAVGHGRAELAEAAAEQMRTLEFYASFWDFSNEPSIELAAKLSELTAGTRPRLLHQRWLRGHRDRHQARAARPVRAGRARADHHPLPQGGLPRGRLGLAGCDGHPTAAAGVRAARARLPLPLDADDRNLDRRPDRRARADNRRARRRSHRSDGRRAGAAASAA